MIHSCRIISRRTAGSSFSTAGDTRKASSFPWRSASSSPLLDHAQLPFGQVFSHAALACLRPITAMRSPSTLR
ncbi:MAG: hypothetical protein RIQ53_2874 [Pseudomonadota bacterium]|jgi:hypothetical protein